MYGMVHQAARAMAIEVLGETGWNTVLAKCGLDDRHFISKEVYTDEITLKLVGAVCEVAQMDTGDLLQAFGRYWISFAQTTSYGPMMDRFGDTLEEFLDGLDDMHSRIQASLPGADMPSFEVIAADDHRIDVVYRSNREGLERFVIGLLEGLVQRFDEPGVVSMADGEETVFTIQRKADAQAA